MTDRSRLETDLLVIGAGMAGLTAAAAAARAGLAVIVVEKADQVGGSALLSGGFVWTADSYDALRRENPNGDPDSGRVLVEDFPRLIDWLRSHDVVLTDLLRPGPIPWGLGCSVDIYRYFRRCVSTVESRQGIVLTNADIQSLSAVDRKIVGAVVSDGSDVYEIAARYTLLATGGFQGDRDLRERYIRPGAGSLVVRSNPSSQGTGLRLALDVGAATSPDMDGYYGHLMPVPLKDPFTPGDYVRLSQVYAGHCVLVDTAGRRFTDESLGYFMCSQALAEQPSRCAVLIGDARVRRDYATQPPAPTMEIIDLPLEAAGTGAHVCFANTLDDLAREIDSWGYRGSDAVATVGEFNVAVGDGLDDLVPDRARNRAALDEAPFFAMEVQPAITFTHGGIRIDGLCRVLDAAGQPIEGLLAAGNDAGGVHNRAYVGGLSVPGVFGLRAAATAATGLGDRAE